MPDKASKGETASSDEKSYIGETGESVPHLVQCIFEGGPIGVIEDLVAPNINNIGLITFNEACRYPTNVKPKRKKVK